MEREIKVLLQTNNVKLTEIDDAEINDMIRYEQYRKIARDRAERG
jgi:hypothetical protein